MLLPLEKIKKFAENIQIEISEDALARFDIFAKMVIEWNRKINLTAITDPEKMAVKHFMDSLTLLNAVSFEEGMSVVDVGTGAGFPGIVLLIMRPDLKITLIDSLKKRLSVIEKILAELGLTAEIIHSRAEDAGKIKSNLRESFDVVTARAVADLYVLSEFCIPLCKKGGVFAAMKGKNIEEELSESKEHIKTLGGKTEKVCPFILDGGDERNIIIIKKSSQTPTIYPRVFSKINK